MIDTAIYILMLILCLAAFGSIIYARAYWTGFYRGMDAADRNNFKRTVAKSRTRAGWKHSRN